LLAACSGIVGASVVLLALLTLPRLQEAGYQKSTSAGLIAATGTLAILIPPSVMLIVLGDQLQTPIPDMFAGAIVPGLLLVAGYAALVIWHARRLPRLTAQAAVSPWRLLFDLGPLLALVVSVLGSIITGLATPTEAGRVRRTANHRPVQEIQPAYAAGSGTQDRDHNLAGDVRHDRCHVLFRGLQGYRRC
jgi:TRAP-type mannitol/chloroaromatic compound transport system permease large subunit